jgi:heptosyltransferase-2
MDALRALNIHVPAGRTPSLFLRAADIEKAKSFLLKSNLTPPFLGLNMGSSRPTKTWPIERFADLAVEWCKRVPGSTLALGGPQESDRVQDFLRAVNDILHETLKDPAEKASIRSRIYGTSELSLSELPTILSQLSVLVGNDSGPKHIAVAVNIPTVTFFGPEHPFEWHPYPIDRHPYFFIEGLPCRKDADPGMPPWCGLYECRVEEQKCMKMIGTQSVLEACLKVAKLNSYVC